MDTDAEEICPPKTLKRPHKLVSPDGKDVRQDPYYWLRDDTRESPDVIRHLEVSPAKLHASRADLLAMSLPQQSADCFCRHTPLHQAGPA